MDFSSNTLIGILGNHPGSDPGQSVAANTFWELGIAVLRVLIQAFLRDCTARTFGSLPIRFLPVRVLERILTAERTSSLPL